MSPRPTPARADQPISPRAAGILAILFVVAIVVGAVDNRAAVIALAVWTVAVFAYMSRKRRI